MGPIAEFDGLEAFETPRHPSAIALLDIWQRAAAPGGDMPANAALRRDDLRPYLQSLTHLRVHDGGQDFEILATGHKFTTDANITKLNPMISTMADVPLVKRWVPILRWFLANERRLPLAFSGDTVAATPRGGRFDALVLPLGDGKTVTHFLIHADFQASPGHMRLARNVWQHTQ